MVLNETSSAADCDAASLGSGAPPTGSICQCTTAGTPTSRIGRTNADGTIGMQGAILQCANASDTTCAAAAMSTASPQYFKNSSGTGYFKCDFSTAAGFSNAQMYNASSPPVSASIGLDIKKRPEIFATEIDLK